MVTNPETKYGPKKFTQMFRSLSPKAIDEMPLTKGPITRAMARRIQEEWASNAHTRPKMNFTWANEDVKT